MERENRDVQKAERNGGWALLSARFVVQGVPAAGMSTRSGGCGQGTAEEAPGKT